MYLSIFLPISIICVIQLDILQWIALIYAVFSSTSLLVVNYYRQMGDYSKNKKILIILIVLIFQFGLLLFFKLYFFQRFSKEVMLENIKIMNNGTNLYNNTDEITYYININETINNSNTNETLNHNDTIIH